MGFDTLHETAISDITDTIKDGIDLTKTLNRPSGVAYSGSLTKATKGLVMEFPVLISKANHIESAGIVAKAYEAKFVTLLQLAFASSNITNSKEGIEYIRNFHTNLRDGFSVDEFIDFMDGFVGEGANMTADSYAKYKAVTEDMKNLSYYFPEDINESSLNDFKIVKEYSNIRVLREADKGKNNGKDKGKPKKNYGFQRRQEFDYSNDDWRAADYHDLIQAQIQKIDDELNHVFVNGEHLPTKERLKRIDLADQQIKSIEAQLKNNAELHSDQKEQLKQDIELKKQQLERLKKQNEIDDAKLALDRDKLNLDRDKLNLDRDKAKRDAQKQQIDMLKTSQDMITNQIVSSDLKKANELVPTMMVVNFVYKEDEVSAPIYNQMVIGVKAKLYEVEPMDVINKIITKNIDSNILLKLVKVSTREISFVRDFLLAIDDAKLDALSRSRRGSTNKLFKVLERRALGGKIRKSIMGKNYYKAISSLVISQEEAEELLKNNIDVSNPRIIRPIMEKLNLISFAVIDESSESVKFIFDTGDDIYETIPLSKLEKEQKDGMSKKVINLMAKINR